MADIRKNQMDKLEFIVANHGAVASAAPVPRTGGFYPLDSGLRWRSVLESSLFSKNL